MGRPYAAKILGVLLTAVTVLAGTASGVAPYCLGDANRDGAVSLGELTGCANNFLGHCFPAPPCDPYDLPATGQTKCFNYPGFGPAEIPCAGTGQDGELRRGVVRSFSDNGDGTITDNVTSLMWEKKSDDDSVHDWDQRRYVWGDAFLFIQNLNTVPCFADHCDWRLPNRTELESIIDLDYSYPSVDPIFHNSCSLFCRVTTCSCTYGSLPYWTSSTLAGSPYDAWAVEFQQGRVSAEYKNNLLVVRAVRGPASTQPTPTQPQPTQPTPIQSTPTRTPTASGPTPTSAPGNCGNGVIDAGEDCDVGGICAGGMKSGTACTSEADCGYPGVCNGTTCVGGSQNGISCTTNEQCGEPGACASGPNTLRECNTDPDCGTGGTCKRCRTFGAQPIPGSTQTCAANCTFETRLTYNLKQGVFNGAILQSGSGVIIHSGILGDVPLALPSTGNEIFTIGKPGPDGVSPIALKAVDVHFPPIPVSTIACACVRGVPAKTCGGFLMDLQGNLGQDCSDAFVTPTTPPCPVAKPCAFVHGPGNSGSGRITCGGNLIPFNLDVTEDSRGSTDPAECLTPGIGAPTCADPPIITLSGSTTVPGSSIIVTHTAIGTKTGGCVDFCTDADPQSTRGTVNPLVLTTGTATGVVFNVDGQDGVNQWNPVTSGPWTVVGGPLTCNAGSFGASGGKLAGTFTAINQNLLGDIVVTEVLAAQ